MNETTSITEAATDARAWFETITRGEGDDAETIWTMRDGRPDWVQELTYKAHGDFLPDDWRYKTIVYALDAIVEGGEYGTDPDHIGFEFADGMVDVYTHDRNAWLSSNLNRAGYVEEAREEGLIGDGADITEQIGVGQYEEAREIFESVRQSLEDRAEELTEKRDVEEAENPDLFRLGRCGTAGARVPAVPSLLADHGRKGTRWTRTRHLPTEWKPPKPN